MRVSQRGEDERVALPGPGQCPRIRRPHGLRVSSRMFREPAGIWVQDASGHRVMTK